MSEMFKNALLGMLGVCVFSGGAAILPRPYDILFIFSLGLLFRALSQLQFQRETAADHVEAAGKKVDHKEKEFENETCAQVFDLERE